MNLEKALKTLREFKDTKDYEKLNTLEEMIIKGITMKKVTETTTRTCYNRALRVLKRNEKKRPILSKTVERSGKQYFSDSYVAFELVDKIPELPIVDNEERYPSLDKIINDPKINNTLEVEYTCKELKQMVNIADKYIDIEVNEDIRVAFDKNLLMDVLMVLGYKNNENVVIKCSPYNPYTFDNTSYSIRPLLFERNSNVAILMPIRVDDSSETTKF